MNSRVYSALGAAALAGALFLGHQVLQAQGSATLSVDGGTQFQVIDGFGVSANVNSWNGGELRPALDMLVDQLGATIWRVVIDNGDWEASNDNTNPNVFNWTYYNGIYTTQKFEELWSTIAYLNQKGVSDRLMLNVMGPVASWMGGSRITTAAEDEWVEMIASLVYYGRVTRGLRFALLAPTNEPDWDGIEGPQVDQWQYVRLLRKLALKLDAVGLGDIRLVGPDTAAIGTGVGNYMPELMTDSLVMSKLDHFAFHNYAGDSGGADQAIRNSAYPSKNFWITEVSNIWDALAHLGQGPAATLVWDAYDSVYNHAILAGRGSTPPNDAGNGPALLAYSQSSGVYTARKAFYEHAQLFRFVRPGARRVRTSVSGSGLTIYAFNDPSRGTVTIVGRNAATGSRAVSGSLSNLPPISSFAFYQTTGSTNLQRGADVAVTNNTFSVQVAAGGVFTLVASTVPDTVSPTVSMTGPSGIVSGSVTVSATASDNVGVVGVQFLLDGISLGSEDTQSPYQVTWNTLTATPGAHQLTARARDLAGNVRVSAAVSVIVDNSDVTPPLVAVTAPAAGATVSGAVTVTATASDNVGVARVQFLLDGVALGTEDTAAPYAVSWSTTSSSNGSHGLAARAWDARGNVTTSATVAVTVSNTGTSPTGLVAAYGFGEGSGSVVSDASGRGHTGTISGAAWSTAGRYGAALSFDGVNDRVTVADSAALDLTTGMTVEAWVRPSSHGAWRTVVLKERSDGLAYGLYSSTDASFPAGYIRASNGDIAVTGSSALPLNAWSHVAVTSDGSALRLFVNAVQRSSLSQTSSIATSANPLSVGGNSVWGEYFAGLIDEVRVYNRALTAAELQSDMNTPIGGPGDTTPPQVTLTAPTQGATVSGVVSLTATASDAVGVAGVQFLVDGLAVGAEDATAPYAVTWNTVGVIAGTHMIAARARDAAGNMTTSSTVTVSVTNGDSTPPTVSVTAPSAGASVSGTVTITASASDNVGVTGVQFLVDGLAVGAEDVAAPYGATWNSRSVTNGIHVVAARARDAAGNQTTASINITVSNDTAAPTVAITSPSAGATVSGAVTVTATASDNVGVARVQFLLDGVALGTEDTTAPYAVSWSTTSSSNGSHGLAARAWDSSGNVTTSATVAVTVSNTGLVAASTSIGADDGLVLESSEGSNQGGFVDSTSATVVALRIGDLDGDQQQKSILSFDTSSIPDGATIISARLRVRRGSLRGSDPFLTHGVALVDIRTGAFGGNPALEQGDFQAAPTAAGVAALSSPMSDGDWSEGILNAAARAAVNRSGLTQLRLYFSFDDDDDGTADYVAFRSGNDSDMASRPQLIVVYQP